MRKAIDRHEQDIVAVVERAAQATARGATVLDVGAGEARFRPLFGHACYLAIDLGRGDSTWDYSGIDVIADAAAMPVRSAVADTALCVQVLEHVRVPQAVLCEITRVLKPGGLLYLTAPQSCGEHQQPYDYFRFTTFSLRMMAEQAGLEVVDVRPINGFFVYLGTRIGMAPKYLFSGVRRRSTRALLLPIEILALVICSVIVPMLLYALDGLDRRRDLTLDYVAIFRRPVPTEGR